MTFDEIMEGYKTDKLTDKQANEELKKIGVTDFYFDSSKKKEVWSEAEMAEGFKPGEPAKPVQRKVNMARRMDLAGKTDIQKVNGRHFEVFYDEEGYAVKAIKK